MATVRQLTTRFNFETDKKGLSDFKGAIGTAKSALGALAGALGVATAAGFLAKVGSNLQKVAVLARQFTDEVVTLDSGTVALYGEMADAWERIQKAIPGAEKMSDFLEAFVKFRQSFKDAPLSQFETLFKAAGSLSRITGKGIQETFDALHNAIVAGDFKTLSEFLPDLDLLDTATLSFVQGLTEVDPTRVLTVAQRLNKVTEILDKANPALAKTAELIMDTTTEGQWDLLLDNIGKVVEQISGPMNKAFAELMIPVNAFFKAWQDGGGTLSAFMAVVEEKLGRELPAIVKTAMAGIASITRDPQGLFSNLALGAERVAGKLSSGSFAVDFRSGANLLLKRTGLMDLIDDVSEGADVLADRFSLGLGQLNPSPGTPSLTPAFLNQKPSFTFSPTITVSGLISGAEEVVNIVVDEIGRLADEAYDQFVNSESEER